MMPGSYYIASKSNPNSLPSPYFTLHPFIRLVLQGKIKSNIAGEI
jgi:hypothetical protein